MRLALLIFAAFCGACVVRPTLAVGDAPECQRSCDAVASRCKDDSAKQRQPDPTTCSEDFHLCLAKCTDRVAGDPAAQAAIAEETRELFFIERLIQSVTGVPSVRSR